MSKFIKLSTKKYPKKSSYTFASIDPGIKNCGILIEQINIQCESPQTTNITKIKKLHYELINLTSLKSFTNIYINTSNYLDSISNLLDSCDFFVIECQLKKNYKALRLHQHFISYFTIKYRNSFKTIIELDPSLKSNIFRNEDINFTFIHNDPSLSPILHNLTTKIEKMKKLKNSRKIKIQSCISCIKLLLHENDHTSLIFLNSLNKLDDVSDVLCQLRAIYSSPILPNLIN